MNKFGIIAAMQEEMKEIEKIMTETIYKNISNLSFILFLIKNPR